MEQYLSGTNADHANLKNIFTHHKNIFRQYSDLHIPKHILKNMIKELQEYHANLTASQDSPNTPPNS